METNLFSSMSFEKKYLLLSFTAIPVGMTSPHASFVKERHSSANNDESSSFPTAVSGKRPEFFTKLFWLVKALHAVVNSSYNLGADVWSLAIFSLRSAWFAALTISSSLPANHFSSSIWSLSQGGLPHMTSNPLLAANTSGNSTHQWKKRCSSAIRFTSVLKSAESWR